MRLSIVSWCRRRQCSAAASTGGGEGRLSSALIAIMAWESYWKLRSSSVIPTVARVLAASSGFSDGRRRLMARKQTGSTINLVRCRLFISFRRVFANTGQRAERVRLSWGPVNHSSTGDRMRALPAYNISTIVHLQRLPPPPPPGAHVHMQSLYFLVLVGRIGSTLFVQKVMRYNERVVPFVRSFVCPMH